MKKKQRIGFGVWCGVSALLAGTVIFLNCYAASYNSALVWQLGTLGGAGNTTGATYDSLNAAENHLTEVTNHDVIKEGTVLLKNDNNALPLNKETEKISVFGMSSILCSRVDRISTTKDALLADGLQDYGFQMNSELRKFYKTSKHTNWGTADPKGDGTDAGTWTIDEVPQSEYTDKVKASYKEYNDAAIVVFSRSCGEGADLPRNMDRFGGGSESYLELNQDEKDLLTAVKEAGFKKTIVILHSANPMQMDFLKDDYGIDSVLWVAGTGAGDGGIKALCEIIAGDANPSGRLVDTYCYDNFSSPAMANFGDFRYVDSTGNPTGYSYINYAEGIYIGYKYYETRYEDKVLGQGNTSDYQYSADVCYPFGYGLSYTDFKWSDFEVKYNEKNQKYTFTLHVENTGDKAGKDVVELYAQSPYTAYDKENGIEKSSVQLVGKAKTSLLEAGKGEDISITVPLSELKTYDENNKGTYILDAGTYYFTAATDSHNAINNILTKKGKTTSDGMDDEGDSSLVYDYVLDVLDDSSFSVGADGNKITNHFADAKLDDATYLSRSDWSVMKNDGLRYSTSTLTGLSNTTDSTKFVYTHEVSSKNDEQLKLTGWEASLNPNHDAEVANGEKSDIELTFQNMAFTDYDDERWDSVLDEVSLDTMHSTYAASASGPANIDSISKSRDYWYDGPEGIHTLKGLAQIMIAATWNKDLAKDYGEINGEIACLDNYNGWYAPGVNLHRTPFSGRNYEYCSEDSFLTADTAVNISLGAESKGLNVIPKHFALNDQETNRNGNNSVATYSSEQNIRETYFSVFEKLVKDGHIKGVMASMNRIGNIRARNNYNLNVLVARNEWGYQGFFITDYIAEMSADDSLACLAGGINLVLSGMPQNLSDEALKDTAVQNLLRDSMHHVLYFSSNSRLAGVKGGSGLPTYVLMLIVVDVVVFGLIAWGTVLKLLGYRLVNAETPDERKLKHHKIHTIVYWSVVGAVVIAALVIFFVWGLPLLQQAFKIQ